MHPVAELHGVAHPRVIVTSGAPNATGLVPPLGSAACHLGSRAPTSASGTTTVGGMVAAGRRGPPRQGSSTGRARPRRRLSWCRSSTSPDRRPGRTCPQNRCRRIGHLGGHGESQAEVRGAVGHRSAVIRGHADQHRIASRVSSGGSGRRRGRWLESRRRCSASGRDSRHEASFQFWGSRRTVTSLACCPTTEPTIAGPYRSFLLW